MASPSAQDDMARPVQAMLDPIVSAGSTRQTTRNEDVVHSPA